MNNNQQEDEKDAAAGTKTQALRISTLFKLFASILVLLVLTRRINSSTGTAELLVPLQLTPTNLSQEEPHSHFGDNTEAQNRQINGQSEINESEAA